MKLRGSLEIFQKFTSQQTGKSRRNT
jgi:hypothetical protein